MKPSHPRTTGRRTVLLAAACIPWAVLAAEPGAAGTWRCGNTYTDQPCKGGKAIDFEDPRSAAQKREADGATLQAREAADRLERERIRQESVASRRKATLIGDPPGPAQPKRMLAKTERKNRSRQQPDYFSAHDPVTTAKNKAAKAAAKSTSRNATTPPSPQ